MGETVPVTCNTGFIARPVAARLPEAGNPGSGQIATDLALTAATRRGGALPRVDTLREPVSTSAPRRFLTDH